MSAHANPWITFIENYWWLGFFFGGAILAAIGSLFEGVGEWLSEMSRLRHKRRIQIEKIRARAALAPQAAALPQPGLCTHRRVVPVIASGDDKPSAWLCKGCDSQLPADWAVRAEDL